MTSVIETFNYMTSNRNFQLFDLSNRNFQLYDHCNSNFQLDELCNKKNSII